MKLVAALVLALAAQPALAASPGDLLDQAKAVRHGALTPFAVVSANPALGDRIVVDAFYAGPVPSSGAVRTWTWSVRRSSIDKLTGAATVSWASSQDCTALEDWIGRLTRIPGPQVNAPGLVPPGQMLAPPMDGTEYQLWASGSLYAAPSSAIRGGGEMAYSARSGGPLDLWWSSARLDACWKAVEPG